MFIELIQQYPRTGIIAFSFVITLFITVVTYFMTDKQKMREIRERQKKLQEEMKNHKDNPDKLMELQKEMFKNLPEQMKHSFKPMLVTIIPLLIVYAWLGKTFRATSLGNWWIAYYIGASIVFSMLLRKIFKLQ